MNKLDRYLAAERARLAGSTPEAIALYRDALKIDPDDDAIRARLAEALRDAGDVHRALMELFTAANRLIWRGSYDDARSLLEKMRQWDPAGEDPMTQQVPAALQQIADAATVPPEDDEPLLLEDTRSFLLKVVLEESEDFAILDAAMASTTEEPRAGRATDPAPELEPAPPEEAPAVAESRSAGKRVSLVVDGGRVVEVPGSSFLIGSGPDCDLVLKKRGVAPQHASILELGGLTILKALQVGSPTIVNGAVVPHAILASKDTIALGPDGVRLKVRIEIERPSRGEPARAGMAD